MRRAVIHRWNGAFEVETLLSLAAHTVKVDHSVTQRARDLDAAGYALFDALHLAAAESAGADVLLSWSKEQGL